MNNLNQVKKSTIIKSINTSIKITVHIIEVEINNYTEIKKDKYKTKLIIYN